MAELKAQTTRGQSLGEKPPEVWTVYAPDGTEHKCAPCDAREILAAGNGYTAEPPAAPPAPLTGEDIINAAFAEVAKREQQPEQQSIISDDTAAAATETASVGEVKPDDKGGTKRGKAGR